MKSSLVAKQSGSASFEQLEGDRARVIGVLDFSTAGRMLVAGSAAISAGRAQFIDLAGVTASDSAGLALLLEWTSVARAGQRTLRFENMPAQLQQLARLSEVELLVLGS